MCDLEKERLDLFLALKVSTKALLVSTLRLFSTQLQQLSQATYGQDSKTDLDI